MPASVEVNIVEHILFSGNINGINGHTSCFEVSFNTRCFQQFFSSHTASLVLFGVTIGMDLPKSGRTIHIFFHLGPPRPGHLSRSRPPWLALSNGASPWARRFQSGGAAEQGRASLSWWCEEQMV